MTGRAGIAELTGRFGGYCWVEARLFELLGRWSVVETEPQAKALWATTSRHCAWHSELWSEQLPDSPALAARSGIAEPADWAPWGEMFVHGVETGSSADRLDGFVAGVCPWLIAGYQALADRLVPVSDAATLRVLAFVLTDHRSALKRAEQIRAGAGAS